MSNRGTHAAAILLDGEAQLLARKAVEMALAGDAAALRLCLDRIVAPRRAQPCSLDLPEIRNAGDIGDAMAVADRRRRTRRDHRSEALCDKIIVGIPEMVADRLMQLRDAPGLDRILAKLNCGTRICNDRIMNSPQLLCEKVKPRFH